MHISLKSALLSMMVCAQAMSTAHAHNVWLEPDDHGAYTVQFGGHEGKLEAFSFDKLKSVQAYDRRGRDIAVQIERAPGGAKVVPERQPAILTAYFENGYFSKTASEAMINQPMDKNPGAISGVYAVKYHKTIVQWGAVARREFGQEFEIIPLQADTPKAGEAIALQVLFKGKPAAGIRVSLGEDQQIANTDKEGRVTIRPVTGVNQVQAIRRAPVNGDARTTSTSHEYLLAFPVHD